jgi:hypothetical protein
MQVSIQRRPTLMPLAFAIFSVSLLIGCGSRDQITTSNVPKETKTPPPTGTTQATPATIGEPTHRMLTAILPAGNQAWFFKVVGPLDAVEKQEAEINKFFASIIAGDGDRPKWELPTADWKEEQGSGMRAATIHVPAEGEPLELSVIALPWRGAPGELLSNVNRWRGQMKSPPVEEGQLAEFTREIKSGDSTITIVDLRGQFEAGPGMVPPFAGGAQGQGGQAPALPPGHPPINGATDGDR